MPGRGRVAVLFAVVVVLVAGAALWWSLARRPGATELTLYGNVDLRQVELPFNGSERIAAVLVQEGDHVRQGQLLARLDTSRLAPQVAKAEADLAAQQQVVDRLHHGNRPEEIAQARANVDAAAADADNARAQYARLRTLSAQLLRSCGEPAGHGLGQGGARHRRGALGGESEGAGARSRRPAHAKTSRRLRRSCAPIRRSSRCCSSSSKMRICVAPLDAVVRSRIVEPGEISSPQKTAFTLAIVDPKWVRAYVAETDLGSVREGMDAAVTVDAFPGRRFSGWVGFISPVAEFTPKIGGDHGAALEPGVRNSRVRAAIPATSCDWACPRPCILPLRGDHGDPPPSAGARAKHGGA